MEIPTLTPVERLTLANQFKILAALGEGSVATHTRNAEILLGGHTSYYENVFNDLAEEVPVKVTEELQDILDMFFGISTVYKERPKSEIEAAGLDRKKLAFNGFDFDNDQYAKQAKFMVERQNRYEELKNGRFNSHTPDDMRRYRRMLPIYQAAFKSTEGLTVHTLKAMQEAV
ncbi:MAG: YfbU family protein [Janthinobacterium lividum]